MNLKITARKEGEPMLRIRGYCNRLIHAHVAGPAGSTKEHRRGICAEEGATLVEFAISCSVLLMMLLGIIQVSLLVYTYDFVSEAARDGARYAIVRGSKCIGFPDCNATSTQIQAHIQTLNFPAINTSNLTATAVWCQAAAAPPNMVWSTCTATTPKIQGNAVKVTVQYPFPLNIPFWGKTTVNLSNSSQMVMSQ
jgi:Flp pilus assembly protein TadG